MTKKIQINLLVLITILSQINVFAFRLPWEDKRTYVAARFCNDKTLNIKSNVKYSTIPQWPYLLASYEEVIPNELF